MYAVTQHELRTHMSMSHDNSDGTVSEENVRSTNESAISKETRSIPGGRASKRLRLDTMTSENFRRTKRNTEPKEKPQSKNSFCNLQVDEQTHRLDLVEPGETSDLVCALDSGPIEVVPPDESLPEYDDFLYTPACVVKQNQRREQLKYFISFCQTFSTLCKSVSDKQYENVLSALWDNLEYLPLFPSTNAEVQEIRKKIACAASKDTAHIRFLRMEEICDSGLAYTIL